MDNFYICLSLAKELCCITDNKASLIGTIRANNVEKGNKEYVQEAMKMLEDAPQGSWKLVQVLENVLRVANTLPACCGGCQSNDGNGSNNNPNNIGLADMQPEVGDSNNNELQVAS